MHTFKGVSTDRSKPAPHLDQFSSDHLDQYLPSHRPADYDSSNRLNNLVIENTTAPAPAPAPAPKTSKTDKNLDRFAKLTQFYKRIVYSLKNFFS